MPRFTRRLATSLLGVSVIGAAAVFATHDKNLHTVDVASFKDYRLTSVDITGEQITLAWNGTDPVYRVRIGTDLDRPLLDTTTTDPVASISEFDEEVSQPSTLRYRIEKVDESESETVLSGVITLPPEQVAKPEIEQIESNGLELRWESAEDVTNYDIGFTKDAKSEPEEIHRTLSDEPHFVTTDLKPGSTGFVRVRAVRNGVLGEYSKAIEYSTPKTTSEIAIGAWNVCSEKCSGYSSRSVAQAAKVDESKMDIMTLQEAGGVRVGRTTNAAYSGGEQGFVRASGGAKARWIFYRPARFDQLAGGHFSVGYGRTVTWARFLDLNTEQRFIVASVHLVPGRNGKKDKQRGSQAASLSAQIKRLNPDGDPVVLAGDFNTGRHRGGDRVFGVLTRAGYQDTREFADTVENAQMNSFNSNSAKPRNSGDHVDHIFVSGGVSVPLWRQYNHLRNGKVLTDHNMIAAKVSLKREGEPLKDPTRVVIIPQTLTQTIAEEANRP